MVLRSDGEKILLLNPKAARYDNQPGGLFWIVEHAEGIYQLEASKLVEYHEVTPAPGSGQVETVFKGYY